MAIMVVVVVVVVVAAAAAAAAVVVVVVVVVVVCRVCTYSCGGDVGPCMVLFLLIVPCY